MGFFSKLFQLFSNTNTNNSTSSNNQNTSGANNVNTSNSENINIPPENLFIDKSTPNINNVGLPEIEQEKFIIKDDKSLETFLLYLMRNLEEEGYAEALKVPDMNYMNMNIERRLIDITIVLERSALYHKEKLKEIEVHIDLHKNSGLHDIVNRLEKEKQLFTYYLQRINELAKDFSERKGYCHRIVQSYTIGFKRGVTALTKDEFNLY